MAALRETLMEVLQGVRDGKIAPDSAKAAAAVAQTVINSVAVQIDYERLRLESKLPSVLPEMPLTPPLLEARSTNIETPRNHDNEAP